jgi:murein L,D-transpeptidase YcbB/YkuD
MFSRHTAAYFGAKRHPILRNLAMWSVASAALLGPHAASADSLTVWSAAVSSQTPALVEMNAARASEILNYRTPIGLWTSDHSDAAASPETESLAAAAKAWAGAEFSGLRASERRRRRLEIAAFYEARDNRPLWRDGARFTPAAIAALSALQEADRDGLNLAKTQPPKPEHGWSGAQAELAISEAIAEYAAQASGERVDPQSISKLIGMKPILPETAQVLAAVSAAGADAGKTLQNFNPPHEGYRALKQKLAELRAMRLSDSQHAVTRVADARVTATDATPSPDPNALTQSDARLAEAEIVANMERWRWLPRDLGADRIEVNIPDFELAVKRNDSVVHRTRVIVGKTTTPTPVFSDRMRFIVVNPSWSVPPSIVRKEMAAKHGGDLSYLAGRGFQISYRNGHASVRQPPGERNALGRVKFVFPNAYSVYLHDTPTRNLFSQTRRALSHGCVRVHEPFKLAESVLAPQGEWSESRLRGMIGASERRIDLAEPLPVHIEYFTAFVDENGRLQLREDIYGYSAKTRAALKLDGV